MPSQIISSRRDVWWVDENAVNEFQRSGGTPRDGTTIIGEFGFGTRRSEGTQRASMKNPTQQMFLRNME